MAVRKIEYTVSADGVSPVAIQPGGVQGEHRATEVVFNLESKLYSDLQAIRKNGERLVYRVDGYTGEGGVSQSDTYTLSDIVSYLIEEWLTRYGGTIKLVLVISLIKNGETEMELYSFPVMIRLKNLPDGKTVDGVNYESMSTLAQVAKDSVNTAVGAAKEAVEAQVKTEETKLSLEQGTEWIFDGGNSFDEIDVELEEFVTEQGAKGNWTYRKWNSGVAECWFNGNLTFPTEAVGGGIEGILLVSIDVNLPFEFINKPFSVCDIGWFASNWVQCSASTTKVTVRKFANQSGINATTNDVSIYVKGRWK